LGAHGCSLRGGLVDSSLLACLPALGELRQQFDVTLAACCWSNRAVAALVDGCGGCAGCQGRPGLTITLICIVDWAEGVWQKELRSSRCNTAV
jgi:hypothetical protein